MIQEEELRKMMRVLNPEKCPRCFGSGVVFWWSLIEYDGPAIDTGVDDTLYICDLCDGTGIEG